MTPTETLVKKRNEFRQEFKSKYRNAIEATSRAAQFVRGIHDPRLTSSNSLVGGDILPEDVEGDQDREAYSVPYLPSRIDKMIQYIRGDDMPPMVEAEEEYNFPKPSPEMSELGPVMPMQDMFTAFDVLRGGFPDATDNELYAKMATARLKLFCDRAQMGRIEDEILDISALERVCGVYVSEYSDESTREPVRIELCQPGLFGWDPLAAKVEDGRFCFYTEKDVSRLAAQERYNTRIDTTSDLDTGRADEHESLDGLVSLEHWWIKDVSLKDVNDDAVDSNLVYQYRHGWRYVVFCRDQVLYDGPMHSPMGWSKPPLLIHSWRPMPRTVYGMSLYDLAKDQTRAMDRLLQSAVKSAVRQQSKTIYDKNVLEDPTEIQNGAVAGFVGVELKPGKSIADGLYYMPAGAASVANIEMYERTKAETDDYCGAGGLAFDDASKLELSGDALEGLAQDRDGAAGRIRDSWTWFRKDLYTLILLTLIESEDQEVRVKIDTPQGRVSVAMPPKSMSLAAVDYEARFDVVTKSPRNMPRNPVKRASYILQVMQTVAGIGQQDPELARLYVEVADLPHKNKLLQYLNDKQQQPVPAMQPAENPAEAARIEAMQAEHEAMLKVKVRAAESMSDALEEVAKKMAEVDPLGAIDLALSIPAQVEAAFSGPQQVIPPPQGEIL